MGTRSMGETTGIAWTQKTWNCWQGCHKVSPGCKHCYMYSEKIRYGQKPDVVVRSKPPTFLAPLKWNEPALVFTCSWSDFFLEEADEWRDEAFDVIRKTPHLTYQILTKRPERIDACRPGDWPFPNVWLGVSAENQETLDARIPLLLETPAAVRFLSLEPLLASVKLAHGVYTWAPEGSLRKRSLQGIGWVIVGGESGAKARPFELEWLRSIVEESRAARVPVFVKQDAGAHSGMQGRIPEELWLKEFPECAPQAPIQSGGVR
jgi:protein gp37